MARNGNGRSLDESQALVKRKADQLIGVYLRPVADGDQAWYNYIATR